MNRIKALEILKNINVYGYATEVEKQIDEVIAELEALENRSCSNCKYSSIRFNIDCNLINKLDLPENFCCNKWKKKA